MTDTFGPLNATTDLETLLKVQTYKDLHGKAVSDIVQSIHNDPSIFKSGATCPFISSSLSTQTLTTQPTSQSLEIRQVDIALIEKGLPHFHAITENYFETRLPDTFNWDEVASRLGKEWAGEWYIVAFRSVRNDRADAKALYEADGLAHKEALESGGLLKYWYGSLNERRQCLAMCVWSSRDFAKLATRKPYHRLASSLASEMYESYTLERWSLTKHVGETVFHLNQL
ncbi:hypothetical protein HDU80_011130 [Chytriomyces hyalinus]|nr:hypothetical protein HDU80_011130 [Chytriomyces hyalinus]